MNTLAVIPARGRSERIPRKNMRDLGGRPLVQWTIEAALQAEGIDTVVVSTEDVEIATLAAKLGALVAPQPLDSALSGTRSLPVVISALDYMRDVFGYEPHDVCLLHPTSPFRTYFDIDRAVRLAKRWHRAGTPATVLSFSNEEMDGALYLTSVTRLRACRSFIAEPIVPLFINAPRGCADINTWDDLESARQYLKDHDLCI